MASKEKIAELIKLLKAHLKSAEDWSEFPIAIEGLTIKKLPESKNKSASLSMVFNPLGKRKGTYFHNADEFKTTLDKMTEIVDKATILLKCIEKVNGVSATKTPKKSEGFKL